VVLDEPCTGLNPAEVEQLIGLLQSHCAGKTMVLVEHDVSVVLRLAHRIAVLDQGRLIACDRPDAIRANPLVQAAYLGSLHGL
jgi:branched-chain amino acid transport system ATP-binding protein